MNKRALFGAPRTLMLLGTLVASAAACSSSEANDPPHASTQWALRGTYTAATPGPIAELTFYDGTDYSLRKGDCTSSCSQFGKYTLDDQHVLTLKAETGETTVIPLGDVPASSLTQQSLQPLDTPLQTGQGTSLITPGTTPLVNGSPSPGAVQANGQTLNRTANPRINVAGAEVVICGSKDKGCARCSAKIGDRDLTPDEQESCTLQAIRPWLKDRIEALFSQAGRGGLFLRSTPADAPVRLTRINVLAQSEEVSTRLRGSFLVGEGEQASELANAGVSVSSARAALTVSFAFEDATQGATNLLSETYGMGKIYSLTPFFYMHANVGVHLNVGRILSTFGGGAIASTLISTLSGNPSLSVDADRVIQWSSPRCPDAAMDNGASAADAHTTFDRDFLQNVLVPLCQQYKEDNANPNVQCSNDTRILETVLESATKAIGPHRVLPIEACTLSKSGVVAANTYTLDLVAPKRWGFVEADEGFLYARSALDARRWEKNERVKVLAHDQGTCGKRALGPDEECVHVQLVRRNFQDDCSSINTDTTRRFGLAQTDGVDGSILDQMP